MRNPESGSPPITCTRCNSTEVTPSGWCGACEASYDAWSRRHASDILFAAFGGAAVIMTVGVALPLLGVGWLVAASGAVTAGVTILGIHRLARRRRRRQFLVAGIPKAYLPPPK